MKKSRIIYILFGLILLIATIITGSYGLSKEDKEVYNEGLSLQGGIDTLGFKDFVLEEYKVRFYDGKNDYVVSRNSIEKEQPALNKFVATIYEVDGEYQVIIPTIENFKKLFSPFGSIENIREESVDGNTLEYGKTDHVATLWHEAFHAYQFTNFDHNITRLFPEGVSEEIIVEKIDSNKQAADLLSEAIPILHRAYQTKDREEIRAYIKDYLAILEQRKEILGENLINIEDYYKAIEGTAYYVEAYSYFLQTDKASFEERYISDFSYTNGSNKYYNIGMLECLLLDKLDDKWNKNYDFSKTIDDMLYEAVEY